MAFHSKGERLKADAIIDITSFSYGGMCNSETGLRPKTRTGGESDNLDFANGKMKRRPKSLWAGLV